MAVHTVGLEVEGPRDCEICFDGIADGSGILYCLACESSYHLSCVEVLVRDSLLKGPSVKD